MFTGIIQEVARVNLALPGKLTVTSSLHRGLGLGDSMAINGACLTITHLDVDSFSVEVTPETMRRTNLGLLRAGDSVNLELPLALGGLLGGHLVQGHVDGTARVVSLVQHGSEMIIRLEMSPELMCYVVEKGFVAVDGISLTVVARDAISFEVSVIDYTRRHTTLGKRRVGDLVNLEVDIIAKYVEQLNRSQSPGITADFLEQHGFLVG